MDQALCKLCSKGYDHRALVWLSYMCPLLVGQRRNRCVSGGLALKSSKQLCPKNHWHSLNTLFRLDNSLVYSIERSWFWTLMNPYVPIDSFQVAHKFHGYKIWDVALWLFAESSVHARTLLFLFLWGSRPISRQIFFSCQSTPVNINDGSILLSVPICHAT